MNRKAVKQIYRACRFVVVLLLAGVAAGCAHSLHAPLQPDGWSAQPIAVMSRFAPDADLDSATVTPVGDEGYYLYILNESANWDFSGAVSLVLTISLRPWAHSWLMLESPGERLEFGHTGDLGLEEPRYHEGVMQLGQSDDPNPIAYLWRTMSDGQLQIGKPNRPPTFVWRMPITRHRYQLIHEYMLQRKYDQFGVRSDNCTDMAAETAALAGINLIHRIRLTAPQEVKFLGRMLRVWTDPKYRIVEFSTPEVMEADLRQLTQLGIGTDVTEWYLALKE